MQTISCKNLEEYKVLVKEISKELNPGDIIFLSGEIGAGKTTFVQLFGEVIGIKEPITSPTFNIIKTYEDKICHVDGYRLSGEEIELDYYLNGEYFVFIEWNDCLDNYLTPTIEIDIKYQEVGREITIKRNGA